MSDSVFKVVPEEGVFIAFVLELAEGPRGICAGSIAPTSERAERGIGFPRCVRPYGLGTLEGVA